MDTETLDLCRRVALKLGIELDEDTDRIYFPVGDDQVGNEHVTTLNTPGGRYLLERYLENMSYFVEYSNKLSGGTIQGVNGESLNGQVEHYYVVKHSSLRPLAMAVSEFVPYALLSAIDEALRKETP